ncbi:MULTISPECIES: hypothetical protein [unclassified Sphingomonas]|uniref:hypothetical protein n=1 Tax=unclassified Sphingomonas TaxID=196159 RepID=UPI0022B48A55|nr:hypothetical protein [Sphingomonas sp. NIBR02145]WHU03455.1 hypothetical protein O3305_02290 [Sphingomonas sp. NIBR02145]|eukprot:TRINITY_DN94571_c0_g1_i1.p1 TRINITY_DN94571_c0_g1~~TRINITY_DN94571_c0_g1_i1.p1  ORF type:complete len:203 (+),score=34.44 TRINITY_DN94571_c0_g1_i1:352-960(+)
MTISILLAVYASNSMGEDVTSQVAAMVAGGNDDVAVNNGSFGDPDSGATKYFLAWYTATGLNSGNPIGLAAVENTTVDLIPSPGYPAYYFNTAPQPSVAQSANTPFQVKRAIYGSSNNGFDVTAICQAILNQGGLIVDQGTTNFQLALNNETFGGDPDYGNSKYFAMQYEVNGVTAYIGGAEGQTLSLGLIPAIAKAELADA